MVPFRAIVSVLEMAPTSRILFNLIHLVHLHGVTLRSFTYGHLESVRRITCINIVNRQN